MRSQDQPGLTAIGCQQKKFCYEKYLYYYVLVPIFPVSEASLLLPIFFHPGFFSYLHGIYYWRLFSHLRFSGWVFALGFSLLHSEFVDFFSLLSLFIDKYKMVSPDIFHNV